MPNMQQFYLWIILHLDYVLPMKKIKEEGHFLCPFNGKPVWVYEQRASGIRVFSQHCYSRTRVQRFKDME